MNILLKLDREYCTPNEQNCVIHYNGKYPHNKHRQNTVSWIILTVQLF